MWGGVGRKGGGGPEPLCSCISLQAKKMQLEDDLIASKKTKMVGVKMAKRSNDVIDQCEAMMKKLKKVYMEDRP